MESIVVKGLTRHFSYYEKAEGLSGSLRNLVARKKLVREAVRGVSFSVREGEVIGFLGPNGAGKTTTLKMLSGIMHPSSSEALLHRPEVLFLDEPTIGLDLLSQRAIRDLVRTVILVNRGSVVYD